MQRVFLCLEIYSAHSLDSYLKLLTIFWCSNTAAMLGDLAFANHLQAERF